MHKPPLYLLDANVFIEAERRYYAFDIAPTFWEALIRESNNGRIRSIDKVKEELTRGKGDLKSWAENDYSNHFVSTNLNDVVAAFGQVMRWVQLQGQFTQVAKTDFASGADGWLIAYAMVTGGVLVTHEVHDPYIKRRVPIPNVCRNFRVIYIDTFKMLKRLNVTL